MIAIVINKERKELNKVNEMMLRVQLFFSFQVMIDFQGAERQKLEEPASEIGLEALCAMV